MVAVGAGTSVAVGASSLQAANNRHSKINFNNFLLTAFLHVTGYTNKFTRFQEDRQ
jgi:hypothetical protein